MPRDYLIGPVVKVSTSGEADLTEFDSNFCRGSFFRLTHTSDLTVDNPVATLPGIWHHRVSAGTGWPNVSIL